MTEEENKAIEAIKRTINISKDEKKLTSKIFIDDEELLLNLIEKQANKINKTENKIVIKLNKIVEEMRKEYDMYGKSSAYLDLDEQWDFLYEVRELLEEE